MIDKIKAAWKTAVGIVAGTALVFSIILGEQLSGAKVTQDEWCKFVSIIGQEENEAVIYYANELRLPNTVGECSKGVCSIAPPGYKCALKWEYKTAEVGKGKSVFKAVVPELVAGSLKAWADKTEGVSWLGGRSEASTKITDDKIPDPQLVMEAVSKCWWTSTDATTGKPVLCRNGLKYGPGIGGSEPCTYGGKILPCTSTDSPGAVLLKSDFAWGDVKEITVADAIEVVLVK